MPLGKRIVSSIKNQTVQEENGANANLPQVPQKPIASDTDNSTMFTLFQAEKPQYSFNDIILNKSTYEAIQDVLAVYEKRELIFDKWGLGQTHRKQNRAGVNLYGPSGTGKSMASHAIANQLGRMILTVDYSKNESKYVGETSKNLVAMFDYAKKSGSVIFFDEADALLSRRVTNMSNSTDVSVNQTRSVLLVLINEFDDLILFASNFISNYDPAFIRRILAHIKFELPDEANRLKLWEKYIPQQMPTDADTRKLSEKYDGVSGCDISNAVLGASLRAARQNEPIVHHAYFEESIERILRSKIDNDDIGTPVSRRTVGEDYVKSQFGGRLP